MLPSAVAAPIRIPTSAAPGFPFLHTLADAFAELLMTATLTGAR